MRYFELVSWFLAIAVKSIIWGKYGKVNMYLKDFSNTDLLYYPVRHQIFFYLLPNFFANFAIANLPEIYYLILYYIVSNHSYPFITVRLSFNNYENCFQRKAFIV